MSEIIDLGSIEVDANQIVRQLKQDMRDDWYPDSLGYEDLLVSSTIAEELTKAIEESNGRFAPEPRVELNVPKKGFVLRYSLETSVLDRAYYHSLVHYLAPFYDEVIPPQVLSHRYAGTGKRAGRYLFLHPIEQWKLFEGYVLEEVNTKPVVLLTDIQNYFENIRISDLVEILQQRVYKLTATGAEKARVRSVIDDLERCLGKWCYRESHGLPQNRDASSFLANILMLPVDEEMLNRRYTYYRYMDDIRVAVTNRYEARAALQHLIGELRKLGLNVNAAKTKILEPRMAEYQDQLFRRPRDLEQIDNMWRSRSLAVIRRSFDPLRTLALSLIADGRTQDPGFRFCIQRFENLARCREVEVPQDYYDPIINAAIQELDCQPCSSDQLVRFLKVAPTTSDHEAEIAAFLKDRERAIYDWQNYLLWQLLVHKNHQDDELLDDARKRIGQSHLHADRAGAMLYLGSAGTDEDRYQIACSFERCSHHLMQRNALIAVHELDYSGGIKEHVAPHVLPSVKGTYQRLRQAFRGCYHRPLPPISYLNIYNEISSYE
jgi:hypothetical protein